MYIYIYTHIYLYLVREYFWNSISITFINYTVNIADKHFEIISFH